MFLCIPIMLGCPTKIKPEGDATPRICPRCHNISAISAKSRTWFEFCFIPLIPLDKKHLWICGICQWSAPMQQGWEPEMVGPEYMHPAQQWPGHQWGSSSAAGPDPYNFQPGYQPEYLHQPSPPATGK